MDILPLNLLIIQPTAFCNIQCDYCYLPNRSSTKRISYQIIETLFEKVFRSKFWADGISVVWHAGEPLVVGVDFYEDAFTLIDRLRPGNCEISHSIQSNGILLDEAWCNLIAKYNVKIGLSVDGPAFLNDTYRKTRNGIGTHAAVVNAMKLLEKRGIPFHTISVITRRTLRYPEAFFMFFVRHGVKSIGFNIEEIEGVHQLSSLTSTGLAHVGFNKTPTNKEVEEEYRSFLSRLFRLARQYPDIRVREFHNAVGFLLHSDGVVSSDATPVRQVQVDVDGNVSCFSPELLGMKSDQYGNFHFGNILCDDLEQIFSNQKFLRVNNDIASGVEACRESCEYFFLCGGGSPSNKYYENGTFNSTETMHCRLTKQVLLDVVVDELERVKEGSAAPVESFQLSRKEPTHVTITAPSCHRALVEKGGKKLVELQSDVGLFSTCEWDSARIQINSGIKIIDPGGGDKGDYRSGVFHPKVDWRRLSSEELASLLVPRLSSLNRTVCIFRVSSFIVERFYEFGLDALKVVSKQHYNKCFDTVFMDYWREVHQYLQESFFVSFNPCSLAVNFTEPGKESSSYSSDQGKYIGLHIDNWGEPKVRVDQRDIQGVRVGLNIGQETRDVVFVNLSAQRMVEMTKHHLTPREIARVGQLVKEKNASRFVAFFIECFPNYPVIRISLDPGEGYIMPVNNILHNGYPLDKSVVDVNLQISAHDFQLRAEIVKLWCGGMDA